MLVHLYAYLHMCVCEIFLSFALRSYKIQNNNKLQKAPSFYSFRTEWTYEYPLFKCLLEFIKQAILT